MGDLRENDNEWIVECDTMSGIIRSLNNNVDPPIIHFWSLDCEGCEDVAMETFDWGKTDVAVIMVDSGSRSCGGNPEKCQRYLRERGFHLWLDQSEQIWYSEKYFDMSSASGHVLPPTPRRTERSLLGYVERLSSMMNSLADKMHKGVEEFHHEWDKAYRIVHKLQG